MMGKNYPKCKKVRNRKGSSTWPNYDDLFQLWFVLFKLKMDYDCVLGEKNKRRVQEILKSDEQEKRPRSEPGFRDSAVLVPLLTVNDVPSVLFTVRARHLSRHRNQVR